MLRGCVGSNPTSPTITRGILKEPLHSFHTGSSVLPVIFFPFFPKKYFRRVCQICLAILQKHVTIDFLTKKQIRNNGQVTQYYVKDSHEPIVSRDDWNAVQQEFERRDAFREKHKLSHVGYGSETRPFSSKIICGECGHIYGRKAHLKTTQKTYWQCNTRCYKGPKSCIAENVPEKTFHRVFIEAWNNIVRDQDTMNRYWDRLEKSGTELERLRARQMREMVKQGPLTTIVPELVQTVLESITVKGGGAFEIRFVDGTEFRMKF